MTAASIATATILRTEFLPPLAIRVLRSERAERYAELPVGVLDADP
jgi:hypothetical protein